MQGVQKFSDFEDLGRALVATDSVLVYDPAETDAAKRWKKRTADEIIDDVGDSLIADGYIKPSTGNVILGAKGLTTAGTFTPTSQQGRYIDTGKLVFVNFYIVGTLSGAVGNFTLTGLPFANSAVGGVGSRTSMYFGFRNGVALSGTYTSVSGILYNGATEIRLQKLGTANSASLDVTDVAGSFTMYGSLCYEKA